MKTFYIALIFCCAKAFAQQENSTFCSKRDRIKHQSLKSNSLNLAQIAQTEKYDVNYYKLNLNMTNTSTTLSGYAEMKATAIAAIEKDPVVQELIEQFDAKLIVPSIKPIQK